MARPREFDEAAVLDAAALCFWEHGYDATSIRDLVEKTGLTGASLYNAFGDKRELYHLALDRYVEDILANRIRRCAAMAPRESILAFFDEIVNGSLSDPQLRGCMLVNAAIDVAPHDAEARKAVANVLIRIETFFRVQIAAGQEDGTIARTLTAEDLARHLLGVLMGVRVLARVRPEPALLRGVISVAFALLDERPADGVP
jgi:TetR/AcrR family transcriptional repressor of nem operon